MALSEDGTPLPSLNMSTGPVPDALFAVQLGNKQLHQVMRCLGKLGPDWVTYPSRTWGMARIVYHSKQGFYYFRGRKITENHGNRPPLKITEITENHGKSRKRKLKFLLFAIVVPGRHGKSRKITETEMKVPIVCYCCSWLLSVRVCISLCVFSCDMSSSDENGTPAAKQRKVVLGRSNFQVLWKPGVTRCGVSRVGSVLITRRSQQLRNM